MKIKQIISYLAVLVISAVTLTANANSVGFNLFDSDVDYTTGRVTIIVDYDFTDFAMFGGGVNLYYDTDALEFVSYTRGELAPDAQDQASPIGMLTEPGLYSNAGVGTFDFFDGMTSAGTIGTFEFQLLGPGSGSLFCGAVLCLEVSSLNPFVSLAGQNVSADLLAAGNSSYSLPLPVPVPAAVWFMLSGLGALGWLGRKSA